MGRTPHDTYAKGLAVDALAPLGRTETDVRIAPDPRFADVCFEPTSPPDARAGDLLRRLTSEGRVMLEFARQPPDIPELGTWLGKQLAWWRRLAAEARSEKQARVKEAPLFWGLSTGAPREALAYFRMTPMDAAVWPRGCYEGSPGGQLRVVVISELPREPETLVVRTMGAGVTFREALEDLREKVEGVITTYERPFSRTDHEAFDHPGQVAMGEVRGGRVVRAHEDNIKKKTGK